MPVPPRAESSFVRFRIHLCRFVLAPFDAPRCTKLAFALIERLVSFLSRAAIASFAGSLLRQAISSASVQPRRRTSSAISRWISLANGVGTAASQRFNLTVGKAGVSFASLTASQSIAYGTPTISVSGRVNGPPMLTGTVTVTVASAAYNEAGATA